MKDESQEGKVCGIGEGVADTAVAKGAEERGVGGKGVLGMLNTQPKAREVGAEKAAGRVSNDGGQACRDQLVHRY